MIDGVPIAPYIKLLTLKDQIKKIEIEKKKINQINI